MPYLVTFDLNTAALAELYGNPPNGAYSVLRDHFTTWRFVSLGGTVYVCFEEDCNETASLSLEGLRYFSWFLPSCTRFVAGPFAAEVTLSGLQSMLSSGEPAGGPVLPPGPS